MIVAYYLSAEALMFIDSNTIWGFAAFDVAYHNINF